MTRVENGFTKTESSLPVFTKDQIAEHNSEKTCWIIIHGNVYDVTKYLEDHPGGSEALLEYAGKDGTKGFEDFDHSEFAREEAQKYLIGRFAEAGNSSSGAGGSYAMKMLYVKYAVLGVFACGAFAFCAALSVLIGSVHTGH